ncbi:hypothetical protein D3C80_240770 [compost metagenome]
MIQRGAMRLSGTYSIMTACAFQANLKPALRQRVKKSMSPPPRKLNCTSNSGFGRVSNTRREIRQLPDPWICSTRPVGASMEPNSGCDKTAFEAGASNSRLTGPPTISTPKDFAAETISASHWGEAASSSSIISNHSAEG